MPGFRFSAEWPAYPAAIVPLDGLSIAEASAAAYRCGPEWASPERILIADLIVCLRRGRLRYGGDRRGVIAPGEVLLAPAGSRLGLRSDHPTSPAFAMLGGRVALLGGVALRTAVPMPGLVAQPFELLPIAEEACRSDALRPAGWALSLTALLTAAFISVLRAIPSPGLDQRRFSAAERIEPALAMMRANLDRAVKVAALARACGLSEPQFRRVFLHACADSPAAVHRRLRMAEACRLLRETDQPVHLVAQRTGWADASFFAKAFTAEFGRSPQVWRRQPDAWTESPG